MSRNKIARIRPLGSGADSDEESRFAHYVVGLSVYSAAWSRYLDFDTMAERADLARHSMEDYPNRV